MEQSTTKSNRMLSLDAFRGLAILCMVLSGSIAFGNVLPGWMYHAQVPPPDHTFKPNIAGITWVDLVFPFFLFSMGAAIPLALSKKSAKTPFYVLFSQLVQRYLMLVFFAIFSNHAKIWTLSKQPGTNECFLAIAGFITLFVIYCDWTNKINAKSAIMLKIVGFLVASLFLYTYPFSYGNFNLSHSDIIIIVLANMSLAGSLAWYFTKHKPLLRLGILPIIMAILLTGDNKDSWNTEVFNWSPATWMYQFYYLKYLFIVIPGTLAGDIILKKNPDDKLLSGQGKIAILIPLLIWLLVITNLWGLYTRHLILNLTISTSISITLLLLNKLIMPKSGSTFIFNFLQAGIYLLILGLFFEAYEGGIKKDHSTYSYYFVSAGLAFLVLLSFILLENSGYFKRMCKLFAANGQNPLVAYTAGSLLLIPLLKITGLNTLLDLLNYSAFNGFLKGIIFTGIISGLTLLATRLKFFWKT